MPYEVLWPEQGAAVINRQTELTVIESANHGLQVHARLAVILHRHFRKEARASEIDAAVSESAECGASVEPSAIPGVDPVHAVAGLVAGKQ